MKWGAEVKLSGAKIVLKCLKEQGVEVIFGYPGGAVIPLYDALYDERESFIHIRTAHEQGAVHAADGYARVTGKVGVCFATSGPGATNTITGIANAYMDSIPLVIITGQVARPLLGKDSFQEIDITGMTLSITKHNCIVKEEKNLAKTIREAFKIAKEGRPGPVLIDIPKDIFVNETEFEDLDLENKKEEFTHKEEDLKRAVALINDSKRPVIYAGGGVKAREGSKYLGELAEKAQIPVANTLMGLGTISREHPLSLGLVGMHGYRETNLAVTESDLIIAIGARFSDRVIGKADAFAPGAKILHIDIDEREIDKNKDTHLSLVGEISEILKQMLPLIEKRNRELWLSQIEQWRLDPEITEKYNHFTIIKALNQAFSENTVIVTDVGQHQMWTAQQWKFQKPRSFVTSGGLGTMGFGVGAAIGAKLGNPDKNVILFTGDGSFRMNCNELQTLAKYQIPIVIVVMNNHTLGMVRQWQRMFSNARYSETDIGEEINYSKLAEAYGLRGYKIEDMKSLRKVVEQIKNFKETILVECVIDKEESVYPIVPPGKAIQEFILTE